MADLKPDCAAREKHASVRRKGFVGRALGGVMVGLIAFSATVAYLLRAEGRDPRAIVSAQLEALSAGDIPRAYFYFSDSYRAGITLEDFGRLVASHRRLFRPRQVRFARHRLLGDHAVLELEITTLTGIHYPVEYHLVREKGLWRIADFRYHLAPAQNDSGDTRI